MLKANTGSIFTLLKNIDMRTSKNRQLYNKACKDLSAINQMLMKEDNDTIPFLLCHDIKSCMRDFLNFYIMIKKGKVKPIESIQKLFEEGGKLDERLKKFDTRWISCREANLEVSSGIFCTSPQNIYICAVIINGIKKLVDEELKKQNQPVIVNWDEEFLFRKNETVKAD